MKAVAVIKMVIFMERWKSGVISGGQRLRRETCCFAIVVSYSEVVMRQLRFLSPSHESSSSLQHVIGRTCGRDFLLSDSRTKLEFLRILRVYEEFLEVRVLSYVIMDNHFHLMLEIPPKKLGAAVPMSDERLLAKIKKFYSHQHYIDFFQMLTRLRDAGSDKAAEELKATYTRRMHDLSCFMQCFKMRFTQWYNKAYNRTGTMWEGRFKSVLVEDGYAARVMAAYIDLNPVRAGMVKRPEDYRWSSYGEAMKPKGDRWRALAREGLCRVMQLDQESGGRVSPENSAVIWEKEGGPWYRMMLFADGEEVFVSWPEIGEEKVRVRKGFKREEVEKVLAKGGKLSFGESLRCKVRYLNDGMVFGTRGFVDKVFLEARARFGKKRKSGARPIREVGWKEKRDHLYTMRALKKDVMK